MINKVEELMSKVTDFSTANADELEQFRVGMLGKKG